MRKIALLIVAVFTTLVLFSQTRDTIPFEMKSGIIFIPVSLNGTLERFIFDTGAETTIIKKDKTSGLRKVAFSLKIIKDSHGKVRLQPLYRAGDLRIGSSAISGITMAAFDNSEFFNCLGADGIVGVNIIKQFDWIIDFEKKQLIKFELSDTAYNLSGFEPVDFYTKGYRPRIKLMFGDNILDFLFDTGATNNDVTKPNYEKINNLCLKSYKQIYGTIGVSGQMHRSDESLLILNSQIQKENQPHKAIFNTISVGESKIGNAFWGKNQLFLSWNRQKLLYNKKNAIEYLNYGIGMGMDKDNVVVKTIIFTDQISESGLQINDKIKKINGIPINTYCELINFKDLTQQNEVSLELIDGKLITLKKQNLLE